MTTSPPPSRGRSARSVWCARAMDAASEIWHDELLVEPGGTCPEMRPDNAS